MGEFWFPLILIVVSILAFGISFIADRRGYDGGCGIFLSCLVLAIVLVVWSISYYSSIGDISDMKAFINATKSAYEYTIVSTQEVEIKAVSSTEPSTYEILSIGELAYLKLGSQASERIKEFRAKVEWYNAKLERYKRFNDFWFTQGFIANVSPDLMLIIFK